MFPFVRNPEIGKPAARLDAELDEVVEERVEREAYGLNVEDQAAREQNILDARGGLN